MSTAANPVPDAQSAIAMPREKVRMPVFINEDVLIPDWVVDHESYRRWARSDEFPTSGRFSFIDGTLWVDRSMEEFFSHNQVKLEYSVVIANLVRVEPRGYFGMDGNLWSHPEVGISTEPDGLYFTYDTLQSGRVRLIEGANRGYVELEGTPDMILEVVSDHSVKKDTKVEKDKCARAGVREYWLVDARNAEPSFVIWVLKDADYEAVPSNEGWLASAVFGKEFKLQKESDPLGHPRFQLLVR